MEFGYDHQKGSLRDPFRHPMLDDAFVTVVSTISLLVALPASGATRGRFLLVR